MTPNRNNFIKTSFKPMIEALLVFSDSISPSTRLVQVLSDVLKFQ